MTRWERAWAVDVLAAFAPPEEAGSAPLPAEVDYLSSLERFRSGGTRLASLGLRLAVLLCALAPLWLWGRLSTISRLAPAVRTELVSALLRHRSFSVRELMLLLKLVAAMALLGSPSVRARSGYDHVQSRASVESGLRRKLPLVLERKAPAHQAATVELTEPEREAS